jgi:ABC-type phosphate/phosphonate transport system substrate-binding protein
MSRGEPMAVVNARMYAVNAGVKAHWHHLLGTAVARAGLDWPVIDHDAPRPLSALWARDDLGLAMMCGLPWSRHSPPPTIVAAPVPSPAAFGGRPVYWTDIVVREDAPYQCLDDTYGAVAGYTLADSLSGGVAFALHVVSRNPRGMRAFRASVGDLIHARGVIEALCDGRIDVGPLDAYYHALLRLHEPALAAKVRVIDRSTARPIPPLVATVPLDASTLARLRASLTDTAADPSMRGTMASLLLAGFAFPAAADYEPLSALAIAAAPEFTPES